MDKISNKITDYLCLRNFIPEKDREIYNYGFKLILSDIINFSIVVLSIVFRKFSLKNEIPCRYTGSGAATLRLFAGKHMPVAESRAVVRPFISTIDAIDGICYLIALLMLRLPRLQSNTSCKDTALIPTPFLKHTAVWRRPA